MKLLKRFARSLRLFLCALVAAPFVVFVLLCFCVTSAAIKLIWNLWLSCRLVFLLLFAGIDSVDAG